MTRGLGHKDKKNQTDVCSRSTHVSQRGGTRRGALDGAERGGSEQPAVLPGSPEPDIRTPSSSALGKNHTSHI